MTRLDEILRVLDDPTQREAAAADLLKEVQRLARRIRDDGARDDVVQIVTIKLLALGKLPDRAESYVSTMLLNAYRDWCRANQRPLPAEPEHWRFAPADLVDPGPSPEQLERQLAARLERVIDEACAARAPRYRDDLRRDIGELIALAAGHARIDEIVARESDDGAPPARKRARDRLAQRHSRARRELLDAVDRLASRGAIDAGEAGELRRMCGLLLRCQRRAPGAVDPGDEP